MARRVAVGQLGSGNSDWGLRVSKSGSDAVPSNPNSSAAVAVDELLFDSINPTAGLSVYKVYTITVAAASGGLSDQFRNPGTYTASFGETLGFTPLAICQRVVSGSLHYSEGFTVTENIIHSNLPPAAGGVLDSAGPNDSGFIWETSTTGITIKNYETSQIVVRAVIFYLNTVYSLTSGNTAVENPGNISGTPAFSLVSHQGFKVTWNTSSDAADYVYQYSTSSDFSSSVTTGATTATNVIIGGENTSTVSASTTYYFRVKGRNANGEGSYSSTANATTTAALAPVVVLTDSASTTTSDTANHDSFNWSVTNGGIGCKVVYSSAYSGSTNPNIVLPTQPNINVVSGSFGPTGWQSNGFVSATRYYYITADYDDTAAHTATHTHNHTAQGGGGGGGGL